MKFQRHIFEDGKSAFVVTYDVCSSTQLIEKLMVRYGNVSRYFKLMETLKVFIADEQRRIRIEPYKFTGDGWIILVDEKNGLDVLNFMRELSKLFRSEVKKLVDLLDTPPEITGINFGVDFGPIFRGTMYQRYEYVGRPLVIACRLQGAIKEIEHLPAYKALVSREVFSRLGPVTDVPSSDKVAELRNVEGGAQVRCKMLTLIPPTLAQVIGM
jgi:class 3 adenylate cyclase